MIVDTIAGVEPIQNQESGVYFLMRGGSVVYIGRSSRLRARVSQHKPTKQFDSVLVYEATGREMIDLETALIAHLQPEYNSIIDGLSPRLFGLLCRHGFTNGEDRRLYANQVINKDGQWRAYAHVFDIDHHGTPVEGWVTLRDGRFRVRNEDYDEWEIV